LFIRLHNQGNANASGISVDFYYQDGSGGLSPGAWLPVQNLGGITQSLTGLTLAAGTDNQWSVDWSPNPSGTSHHFCVRAIVTVPSDPNTDNKRVLSNFGNVHVTPGGFVDLGFLRRNLNVQIPQHIQLSIVPRLTPGLEVALRDIQELQADPLLAPGEVRQDAIRLLHRRHAHKPSPHVEPETPHDPCTERLTKQHLEPDPRGHYPADPRTVPPGVAGKPLITLVHSVQGIPQGGITFMVTVDEVVHKDGESTAIG
jgi:hypothetical protein